jgi:hypothetical protein
VKKHKKKNPEKDLVNKLKKVYRKRKKPARVAKKKTNEKHAYDHALVSWKAPEYEKHQKGIIWSVCAALIAVFFIYYGFKNQAWTFSMAVIAAVFAYIVYWNQEPKKTKITVSEIGIKIGSYKIPYSNMKAFWIVYHPPFIKTLNIRTSDTFTPDVVIQLDGQDPTEVRKYFVRQAPEWEGKQENFMDSLTRFLKL